MKPNYIDEIALSIHREVEGEAAGKPSGRDMELYRLYAVLALVKGKKTTLEDVHDAWSAWTAGSRPDHRSLIPFAKLSKAVQELDRPYCDAIREVARRLTWVPSVMPT